MAINEAVFKKGGPVNLPASDELALVAKADGTFKGVDSAGAETSLGGGSATPTAWFNNVAAFLHVAASTLTTTPFASDCWSLTLEIEALAAAGTGGANLLSTKPGGVIQLNSGATANSHRQIRNKDGISAPLITNLRTAKYAVAVRAKVVQTQATFDLIMCNATDAATFDSYVGAVQAVSGVNWVLKVGSAAGVDTGVAFDTNWHTLIFLADGTNVTAYVGDGDGLNITIAGTPQSQSTAPNAAGLWDAYSRNLATNANVETNIDKVMVVTETATT